MGKRIMYESEEHAGASRRNVLRLSGAFGAATLGFGTSATTATADSSGSTSTDDIEKVTIVEGDDETRAMSANILERPDGTLLAFYDKSRLHTAGPAPAEIYRQYSFDGGHTWEDETLVVSMDLFPAEENVLQPAPVYMPDGTILMTVLHRYRGFRTQVDLLRSTDHGETFAYVETVFEPDEKYRITPPTRGLLRHSSGRLIVPTYEAVEPYDYVDDFQFGAYLSDDGGESWYRSETWREGYSPRGLMEPQVAELDDGTLLASIRTTTGRVFFSTSEDRGETWSMAEMSDLPAPESNTSLRQLPHNTDLLHLWNDGNYYEPDEAYSRTPLTAAVSRDGGETWENKRNLFEEPRETYGNIGCGFTSDNTAIVHWWESGVHLKAAVVPLTWFYRGNS